MLRFLDVRKFDALSSLNVSIDGFKIFADWVWSNLIDNWLKGNEIYSIEVIPQHIFFMVINWFIFDIISLPISPLLLNCELFIMKGRLFLKLLVPLMRNGRLIRDSGENQSNQTFYWKDKSIIHRTRLTLNEKFELNDKTFLIELIISQKCWIYIIDFI